MLVKELVLRDVPPVDIESDILDVLFTMFSSRERILPVFDGPKFVGTVSISRYAKVLREMRGRRPESISVREIVDEKIETVFPTTDVWYVLGKICEKGLYGVPILSGHEFVGMVEREDMLKRFLHLLKGHFRVMDVMSYYVSTNSIHDTVESVTKKIISGTERRVAIMDGDKVAGTITIQDLPNILLTEEADLSSMSIKNILVPNTVTVSKSDDATKAGEIMLEWGIGGVPVVDSGLEGIVRDKDILQRIHHIL